MKATIYALAGFAFGGVVALLLVSAPAPVSCYQIVSIRPEQHAVVLFNECTGDIEVRFLALPPTSKEPNTSF